MPDRPSCEPILTTPSDHGKEWRACRTTMLNVGMRSTSPMSRHISRACLPSQRTKPAAPSSIMCVACQGEPSVPYRSVKAAELARLTHRAAGARHMLTLSRLFYLIVSLRPVSAGGRLLKNIRQTWRMRLQIKV